MLQESDYSLLDIDMSFSLLKTTFPRRYLHLDASKLLDKSKPVTARNKAAVRGMRLFRRITAGSVDICVFYFVRLKFNPPAYCLTTGVNPNIANTTAAAATILYDEIKAVCAYLQSVGQGSHKIDVVNERELPGDIIELGCAEVVKEAFNIAVRKSNFDPKDPTFVTGSPWPPVLWRYPLKSV